ncbi:MAG: sodium:calcium antiporter [Bacilli bacterium]
MFWIYPVYVVLLCVVVFLSIKLANLVDFLDKKTNISGAFIGGVLLAAVTSLPELFTSISSVTIVNDPTLVIGDILGSDIFNLMILALYTVIFFKNFKTAKISKWHFVSLMALLLMYGLTAYAVLAPSQYQPMMGSINAISIIILAIYVVLIIKQPKESSEEESEAVDSKLTLKQIIILFIICSVILIAASIGITYVTDLITEEIPWLGGTAAGAILLGVATSLPEVISTFHLFKIKNLDAGYGNMIGSCTFNFLVLSIADLISWTNWNGEIVADRGIFISNADSRQLVIFGLVGIASIVGLLSFKLFSKFYENKKSSLAVAITFALISLTSYLLVFIL